MRRRTFILTSVVALVIITIPEIIYRCRNTQSNNPLTRPDVLSRFCDEKSIREIGICYRRQMPDEDKKEKLIELLLTNDTGKKAVATSQANSVIRDWIEQKIQEEFKTGRTVIVAGWILSETEARQCALLSFTNN